MKQPDAGGESDRGSAAVELVLVTPLLVMLLLVVVAFGRLADARLIVADAAHQAARAASLARTEQDARAEAERAARTALGAAGKACGRPHVQVSTAGLRPGASVTARVTCTTALGDLTLTRMPGQMTIEGEALSVIDTYRSSP